MEYSLLINSIKKIVTLSKKDEEAIRSKGQVEKYSKKLILENYDSIYKSLYFVNKGCIQLCTISDEGAEHTIQFSIEGWWLTDFDSFNYQKKSFYQLKAINNSEVIKFSRSGLNILKTQIPQLEKYFRIVAERAYSASLYRISLMMTLSKEQRYLHYIKHFPRFANNIPQYILASYLEISPEYLSEIKKKISKS